MWKQDDYGDTHRMIQENHITKAIPWQTVDFLFFPCACCTQEFFHKCHPLLQPSEVPCHTGSTHYSAKTWDKKI